MRRIIYLLVALLLFSNLNAQNDFDNKTTHQLSITKISETITLDGMLNEAIWKNAAVANDFWEKWPNLAAHADPKTEVRMAYNEQYLYAGITCWSEGDYIVQTLKRDQSYWGGDGISLVLDPLNQTVNGFFFGVSPLGVQADATISGDDMNFDWDNKWFCKTKVYEDRWTVEIAIPFKSLRYDATQTEWGINFIRNNTRGNQYHTWTPVPQQFDGIDLGFTGLLKWDAAPQKTKGNIALIPYVTGGYNQDFEEGTDADFRGNAGLDAKIAVSSSLNLDVTINPDFSQVEVDQQVTNLDRFSLFFPERRTFFLENSDILNQLGIPPVRPFFSRTIGLEDGETVPILYGLRLTGNLTDRLRVGLLNMHTKGDDLGQNYTAAAFQQSVLKRSYIKATFLNRQAVDGTSIEKEDYGRNAGGEFTFISEDGKWTAWTLYHHSFKKDFETNNGFHSTGLFYSGRNFQILQNFVYIGTNFYTDMGFVPRLENYDAERDTTIRLGSRHAFTEATYKIYGSESSKLNRQEITFENFLNYNPDWTFNERNNILRYGMNFKNRTNLNFRIRNTEIDLLFPISFLDDVEPLPSRKYNYWSASIEYDSDRRKVFSYTASAQYGSFFNGRRASFRLEARYRVQPWGNFAIALEQNSLNFPTPYGEGSLLLISPRVEINFSKNIFWTTFLQYNTQSDNFNINSRLQWRFSPMSDFFLVYTDNYATDIFAQKNRAIVFKANYWLNL